MLADAEIVVRAPDGDLGADPVIEGARKMVAAALEVGGDAVAPLGALDVRLSPADIDRISAAIPIGAAAGTRYPEGGMRGVYI
jgi:hypothetical protein